MRARDESASPVSALVERAGEAGLLLLLLLAPLPFGSVQKGASLVLVVWAAALAWLILPSRQSADSPIGRARWALALALGAGIGVLQATPLPRALVEWISPAAAQIYGLIPHAAPADWLTLSLRPAASLELAGRIAAYGAVFAVAAALAARGRGAAARILWTVFAVGIFQALYGGYEYLTGHQHIFGYAKRFYTDSATGTYINQNHYAGALEMSLLCGLGIFLAGVRGAAGSARRPPGWRARIVALFEGTGPRSLAIGGALALTGLGLVFSYSRTGLAAASIVGALVALTGTRRSGGRRRGTAVVLLAAAGLLLASLAGWGRIASDLNKQLTPIRWDEGRLRVWRDTAAIVRDHPLAGAGLGAFRTVYPAYRSEGIVTLYDHAHNDWLELAAETGAIGALAALFVLALYAGAVVRGLARHRGPDFPILLGAAGALVSMLLHEITDFNLQIPANAALFAATAGALLGGLWASDRAAGKVVSFRAAGPREGRPRLPLGRIVGAAVALAATLAIAVAWNELEGQRLLGEDAALAGEPEAAAPDSAAPAAPARDSAAPARLVPPEPARAPLHPSAPGVGAAAGGRALAEVRIDLLERARELGTSGADARGALADLLVDRALARAVSGAYDPRSEGPAGAAARPQDGDLRLALEEVRASLGASPSSPAAWIAGYRVVQSASQIGGLAADVPGETLDTLAARFARGAIRSDPRGGRSRRRLASLLLAAGEREESRAGFCVAAGDPFEDVRSIAGEMLDGGFDPDDVAACLPSAFEARAAFARFLDARGLTEDAERAWRRAAEIGPDEPGVWHALSAHAQDAGRHAEALDDARRAMALFARMSPEQRSEILYDAALASRSLGDAAAALDYAERSIAENPNQLFMYNVAATLRFDRGDLAEAIRLWKHLVEEHSNAPYVIENLALFQRSIGRAYERLGLTQPAAEAYRRALRSSPGDAASREGLERASRAR